MISKTNGNLYLLMAALLVFALAITLGRKLERPLLNISMQDSSVNVNSNLLRILSTGNKRLISDLIWIQTLLDSDLEKYHKKDLGNWMYLRFNTIADLDPNFYQNYLYGGQYLSIVKDDIESSALIYERGIEKFPDDYQLIMNAGFNYYFEMGNSKRGLELLEKIQWDKRAPVYLPSIVNKLKYETGSDLATVYELVTEHLSRVTDEALKQKLESNLYAIRAEMDLQCLNQGQDGCNIRDRDGNLYLKSDNKYSAPKPYLPFRINKKRKP